MKLTRRAFSFGLPIGLAWGCGSSASPIASGSPSTPEDRPSRPSPDPLVDGGASASGKRVVVVGAGIAGLTAAWRLAQAGVAVTILEKEARVGGRMFSVSVPGVADPLRPGATKTQDVGAQFFNDRYDTLLSLMRDASLLGQLHTLAADYLTLRRGIWRHASPKDATTIVSSGLLSSLDAWQVKSAYDRAVGDVAGLAVDDHRAWTAFDDYDAARWLSENYGQNGAQYLGHPAIETLFFYRPADVSRAVFMWIIANLATTRAWSTTVGATGTIAEGIASKIRGLGVAIELSKGVSRIASEGRRVRVRLLSGEEDTVDGVIVTTPSPISREIIDKPTPAQQAVLANEYASTIVVNFHTQTAAEDVFGLDTPAYVAHVPGVERRGQVAGFSIESGKLTATERSRWRGHEIYGVHLADAGARDLSTRSDAEVTEAVRQELRGYQPDLLRTEVLAVTQRWPHAIPMSRPGRSRTLADLWRDQEQGDHRVLLAGDQTTFATMDAAARSGHMAAALLVQKMSG